MEPWSPGREPPDTAGLIDRRRVLAGGLSLAATVWAAPAITRLPASYARGTTPDPFVETFVTPGTFTYTVPAGVTSLTIECWGAGGAGGGTSLARVFPFPAALARGGAGGGGGAYASSVLTVAPGDDLTVDVPAGAVGSAEADGASGAEASVIGPNPTAQTVIAAGGVGGTGNTSGGAPPGGAGGQASASTGGVTTSGLAGTDGATGTGIASGNGGNAAGIGGGSGGISIGNEGTSSDGNPGFDPGGGGGGARTSILDNGVRAGGTGGDGQVVITFQP